MASSLEKLASYLDELKIIRSEFLHLSDTAFELLMREGVFPYECVDSLAKLGEKELSSREDFYSLLNDSHVSNEDYEHAKTVWREFNVEYLGEYSDLHLKTDVLLLADIFENFRDNCIKAYGLDPAHYYTTPGFTWDAEIRQDRNGTCHGLGPTLVRRTRSKRRSDPVL